MATSTKAERRGAQVLSRSQLLAAYKTMLLSRRLDDKEIQLKRQNKIFFQISGAGHEAVLTAAGMVLKPGARLVLPVLPRPRAVPCSWAMTAGRDALLRRRAPPPIRTRAAARCRATGARRSSTSSRSPRPPARSSCRPWAPPRPPCAPELLGITEGFENDEVVLVTTGDGTTSEGEFWESLNTASNLKLPIVYLVEDNGYAISVPVEVNTAGGSISKIVAGFPGPVRAGGGWMRPARVATPSCRRPSTMPASARGRRSCTRT